MVIRSNDELQAFVERTLSNEEGHYICVDTEFVRETTYWPELCLIQMATFQEAVIIDALEIDLSILIPLWEAENITKVFHAGRQDLEIFWHRLKCLPKPLFDSQIGAMYASMGEAISYDNLIHKLLGVRLDKSMQYTNWAHRPLSEQQLSYALADVTYLQKAYPILLDKLEEQGRKSWPYDDINELCDPKTYEVNLPDLWLRIHMPSGRGQSLALLQDLAAWRERQAQEENSNRGRILKDDVLVKLASKPPASREELQAFLERLKGAERFTDSLWQALSLSLLRPSTSWPHWPGRASMSLENQSVHDLLKILQKQRAEDLQIPARLLVGKKDLERLAQGEMEDIICFSGWRFEAFGHLIHDFLDGKLGLTVQDRRVNLKSF